MILELVGGFYGGLATLGLVIVALWVLAGIVALLGVTILRVGPFILVGLLCYGLYGAVSAESDGYEDGWLAGYPKGYCYEIGRSDCLAPPAPVPPPPPAGHATWDDGYDEGFDRGRFDARNR